MKVGVLNSVLTKIFSGGFYRAHAGMLLFLFAMLVSYCFLINTLGTVRAEDVDFWQLFFTLNVAGNPIFTLIFCLISSCYVYKTYVYISAQLDMEKHAFLFYSLAAMDRNEQLWIWFKIYLKLLLPIILFTLYVLVVGMVFHYFWVPLLLCLFMLLLTSVCSILTVRKLGKPINDSKANRAFIFTKSGKSLSHLYLYQIIYRGKLMLMVSKVLSGVLLWSVPLLLPTDDVDHRLLLLTCVAVVMAHAVIIYQERSFNDRYLSFSLNFPIKFWIRFLGPLLSYGIILLPEMIGLLKVFPFFSAIGAVLLIFSSLSLFRSLLLIDDMKIKRFLIWIFTLFFLYYLMIMFGWGWSLIPFNIGFSWIIFSKNYLNRGLVE